MANNKYLKLSALAFACLVASGVAHAGYAQISPPPNWAANTIRVAANDVSFNGGIRSAASAVVNVGGKAVSMPAAYRFAANAGTVAARAAFLNPGAFALLAVGSAGYAAYEWYKDQRLEVVNGEWVTKHENCAAGSPCYEYSMDAAKYGWQPTPAAAWSLFVKDFYNPYWTKKVNKGCTNSVCTMLNMNEAETVTFNSYTNFPGRRLVPPSITYEPVTAEQFEQTMAGKPIPAGVPQNFPVPLDWPVEPKPILNPTPAPAADPLAVPSPQPLRVPQGEPQPVPNSDPQKWKQPVVDIVPAPTNEEPWRVDLQPKDIEKTSPEGVEKPEPVPPTGTTPSEEKPTEDFCAKNPQVIACQVFTPDELSVTPVTNIDRNMSLQKDSGWAENGSCPADRSVTVQGVTVAMPFTLLCDFANGIRPVVIALAYLSAAVAFIGFARR